jgi:hypothetical protein
VRAVDFCPAGHHLRVSLASRDIGGEIRLDLRRSTCPAVHTSGAVSVDARTARRLWRVPARAGLADLAPILRPREELNEIWKSWIRGSHGGA